MNAGALSLGRPPVSLWIETAFLKYGWIVIGLTFGLAAKYALLIKRGVKIRGMMLLADVLLLPLVALIAYEATAKFGANAEAAALMTALATVGADRLVKLYTERFMSRVDAELREIAEQRHAEIRNEVQAELSGKAVIDDQIAGRAPADYLALRKPPREPGA